MPRLFIAVWPDEATRAAVARVARRVVAGVGGRPVPAAHYHLTLAFLGEVPAGALGAVAAAARSAPPERHALVLDRTGWFPGARALWLGPSSPPASLAAGVGRLRTALAEAGFPVPAEPFVPHVTIARRALEPSEALPFRPVAWPVTGAALVESCPGPDGVEYLVREAWPARVTGG